MGKSIFFIGIPCSGKSTLVQELGKRHNLPTFCEGEENSWPPCVKERNLSGPFGASMWFRSLRVHNYAKAIDCAERGKTALVDSYFDKFFHFILGREGMDWLIFPKDPYFQALLNISKIDFERLPTPNTLVFIKHDYDLWYEMTTTRQRKLEEGFFNKTFFKMQKYLEEGVNRLREKNKTDIIYFTPNSLKKDFNVQTLSKLLNL